MSSDSSRPKTPGRVLMELRKDERSSLLKPLTEYVEWLLNERGNSEALRQFNADLANAEKTISQKIQSREMSTEEGEEKKADLIWWTAIDESSNAGLFIALKMVLERDLLAALEKQLPADTRQLDEIAREVEQRLVAKLEEFLGRDGF